MKHPIRDFVEQNRQSGSTHHLIFIAAVTGGYLVMLNQSARARVLKQYPNLDPDRVLTMQSINTMGSHGQPQRPVFFDAACVAALAHNH